MLRVIASSVLSVDYLHLNADETRHVRLASRPFAGFYSAKQCVSASHCRVTTANRRRNRKCSDARCSSRRSSSFEITNSV